MGPLQPHLATGLTLLTGPVWTLHSQTDNRLDLLFGNLDFAWAHCGHPTLTSSYSLTLLLHTSSTMVLLGITTTLHLQTLAQGGSPSGLL